MLERLKNLDRRWIFLLIALSVALPLLYPLGLGLTPNPESRAVYNYIDSLKPGSKLVISFDYDPASGPELHPMAKAIIHHAFSKKIRVFATALYPVGPSMANDAFAAVKKKHPDVEYGKDYINLGFYYGPTTGLNQLEVFCSSIVTAFPVDEKKQPVTSWPIMKGFSSFKDADFIISLSAGDPGVPAFVSVANARYGLKVGAGVTAVSAPRFYAFYNSGQLTGLLGGLRGAADYEKLAGITDGKGLTGMDAQSLAHLVIIALILISNVIYFFEKKLDGV